MVILWCWYYLKGMPIWLTETGDWLDNPNWQNPTTDGHPSAQAAAAQAFLNIGSVSPQIQTVFWYGYRQVATPFDSFLVDTRGYGRASYCVLYGSPASTCQYASGDSTDSRDYNDPKDHQ